eukprot:354599-Chlamydomonas_euryale.AAC.4
MPFPPPLFPTSPAAIDPSVISFPRVTPFPLSPSPIQPCSRPHGPSPLLCHTHRGVAAELYARRVRRAVGLPPAVVRDLEAAT